MYLVTATSQPEMCSYNASRSQCIHPMMRYLIYTLIQCDICAVSSCKEPASKYVHFTRAPLTHHMHNICEMYSSKCTSCAMYSSNATYVHCIHSSNACECITLTNHVHSLFQCNINALCSSLCNIFIQCKICTMN